MALTITYHKESDNFYSTLNKKVDDYFIANNISKKANRFFFLKATLLLAAYISCYIITLFTANFHIAFWSMVAMGPFAILIGINVAHDAAHSNVSKKDWVNKVFLHCFDMLGANSYMWKSRHVYSHHSFPNILDSDADLKQNSLVRIFPNSEILPAHKFQFLYAPFLYLLYTINWLFFRDFQDFTKERIGSLKIGKHPKFQIFKLIVSKTIYVSYILVLPLSFSIMPWYYVLLAFFLMNFFASLLITLALIPSHVAENSLFLLPDENGVMPNSWSHHQVLSVIDFATDNWFLNFFFGGFNHHIAHHLFPGINHVHSSKITPIIKETILEFGLPYNYEPSFINAYISHYQLLKNNGIQPTT